METSVEAGKTCWANDKRNGGQNCRLGDMRYLNDRLQKRGEVEDGRSTLEVTVQSREIEDTLGRVGFG